MIFYRVMRTAWSAVADGTRTLLAQLQVPTAGATPIPGDDVEVIQPLGVRAKPVVRAGTEACVFELANGQRVAILVDKTRDEGAVEPADGEVVMGGLAAPAAVVHIKADGSIEVSSAGDGHVTVTANGTGEIRLNGSALKVAADTDPVDLGTWTHTPAAGTGVATPCSLSYTPPGGASAPIAPGGTAVTGKVHVTASRRVKTSA